MLCGRRPAAPGQEATASPSPPHYATSVTSQGSAPMIPHEYGPVAPSPVEETLVPGRAPLRWHTMAVEAVATATADSGCERW